MYFKVIRGVLDKAIEEYCAAESVSRKDVCKEMGNHLTEMSKQHQEDDPTIPYEDPLCRLAYLYMHVGANATLFERAIKESEHAKKVLKGRAGKKLRVVAAGGGPGSELLGLVKFLLSKPADLYMPSRIDFVLMDKFSEWGESWDQLSEACESQLEQALAADSVDAPPIAPKFHPLDITDRKAFATYAWLFREVDIVAFNYVVSENLERLDDLEAALKTIAVKANPNAAFVFVDRKEYSERINRWLVQMLPRVGLKPVEELVSHGGIMSGDDQVAPHLGDYPALIGRQPRVKFFTNMYREPTAFSVVAMKDDA